MSIEPIGVIAFIAGICVLWLGPRFGILAFSIACILGTAAAIQLPALGGATLLPSLVVLGFFTLSVLRFQSLRAAGLASLSFPNPGFWLLITVTYGLITALFLPSIFSGMTNVYSMARNDNEVGIITLSLEPRASNVTQSLYLVAGLVCFIVVAALARSGYARSIASAILVAAGLNLVFAFLDLATYATGTQEYLSFIRNANYRMLDSGEIQGFKRIVGSFAEAGAYSYATIGFYAFTISLWLDRYRAPYLSVIAGVSLLTLLLSTSSTAYLTVAAFSLILYASATRRLIENRATQRHFAFILLAPVALAILMAGMMLVPAMMETISALFDSTITNKLTTQSGVERMQWNQQAIEVFFDTYGVGAGVGSVRASSLLVAILANCGILGLMLFGIFLGSVILSGRTPTVASPDAAVSRAGGMACIGLLVAAAVSSGGVDLGLNFSVFAALATNSLRGTLSGSRATAPQRFRRKSVAFQTSPVTPQEPSGLPQPVGHMGRHGGMVLPARSLSQPFVASANRCD